MEAMIFLDSTQLKQNVKLSKVWHKHEAVIYILELKYLDLFIVFTGWFLSMEMLSESYCWGPSSSLYREAGGVQSHIWTSSPT